MATAKEHSTMSLSKLIFFVCCFALLASFTIFVLEKFHVIDLYSKPVNSTSTDTTQAVNVIDYSPANPSDNDATTDKKNNGTIDSPVTQPAEPSKPINVTLSAAGQDVNGGPIVIRAILTNLTGGNCNLSLTNSSNVKTYSANVVWRGTYYSCEGFDVPYGDVTPGTWQLKLSVTQDPNSGEVSKSIIVKAP